MPMHICDLYEMCKKIHRTLVKYEAEVNARERGSEPGSELARGRASELAGRRKINRREKDRKAAAEC